MRPSRGQNPQYVAHQMGHTTLVMTIRYYGRWMRKPERVGRLADHLASKFPPSLPENLPENGRIRHFQRSRHGQRIVASH